MVFCSIEKTNVCTVISSWISQEERPACACNKVQEGEMIHSERGDEGKATGDKNAKEITTIHWFEMGRGRLNFYGGATARHPS